MKPQQLPRIKLPAAVRERIHGHAKAFAVAAADTMIAQLEKQLSAELHRAILDSQPAPPKQRGLDAVGEGETGLSFSKLP